MDRLTQVLGYILTSIVTVDGNPLNPRLDLRAMSKAGFEWTYEGAGPAQLALALLADHLGDDAAALRPGRKIEGPAIIEHEHSCTALAPGSSATVDAEGNLSITV